MKLRFSALKQLKIHTYKSNTFKTFTLKKDLKNSKLKQCKCLLTTVYFAVNQEVKWFKVFDIAKNKNGKKEFSLF